MRVTNVHNGQYNAALDAITDIKFYGPYQFRVLKDANRNAGWKQRTLMVGPFVNPLMGYLCM